MIKIIYSVQIQQHKMEMQFLGTSSMMPTKERNHAGIFFAFKDEGFLFDCGEGTQRQLRIAGIRPTRITKIIISHWHGDHVLGLIGLVQTLCALNYEKTLRIYGPTGTKSRFEKLVKIYNADIALDIEIIDIKEGLFLDRKEYCIEAMALEHSAYCLGFRFMEKDKRKIDMTDVGKLGMKEGPLLGKLVEGKKVVFRGKTINPDDVSYIEKGRVVTIITDTQPCTNALKLAKGADLLVSEATYTSKLEEKSLSYGHMTAKQAALLANQANVKKLILTHFSQRYKTSDEILEDAKTYFNNVVCAYDFMKVRL